MKGEDVVDKKILNSLLITICISFVTLFILNFVFQGLFGEEGLYVALFSSTIFTLIYCTKLILSRLDENIDK